MAKLEPEEGKSVLDGLVVCVALGKVWKESLTELSGGQRSLLALSLVLALLLFKPAPMYILDEVDAGEWLSGWHTFRRFLGRPFIACCISHVPTWPAYGGSSNTCTRPPFSARP